VRGAGIAIGCGSANAAIHEKPALIAFALVSPSLAVAFDEQQARQAAEAQQGRAAKPKKKRTGSTIIRIGGLPTGVTLASIRSRPKPPLDEPGPLRAVERIIAERFADRPAIFVARLLAKPVSIIREYRKKGNVREAESMAQAVQG
jgi:hypothetical protein